MQNYLRKFYDIGDYEDFSESENYIEPNVSICVDGGKKVIYNGQVFSSGRPLKFVSVSNSVSTVKLNKVGSLGISLEYSTDGMNWYGYTTSTDIFLNNFGDYVMFRGSNIRVSSSSSNYFYFAMSGSIAAFGDVTSLLNTVGGDVNLSNAGCCFICLFQDCTSLIKAPELPSTTLSQSCYQQMFKGCTSLTNAPELPATTLAQNCYSSMFNGCTSLTKVPELKVMTLQQGCYSLMFANCTALTTAPELPATTLATSCYKQMFYGCLSLVNPPTLRAQTAVSNCYEGMFTGCSSLKLPPTISLTTTASLCCCQMFMNCTSLTRAPELISTSLASSCYNYMFYKCNKLNYIKALFTTTPSDSYTLSWVDGVSPTGTFVKNSSAGWSVIGTNGIPSGWTVESYNPPSPK